MAAGTSWKAGPALILSTVADIAGVNPAANTYRKIFHIHVANTNAAARTVSLWVGATGGSANGTELVEGKSIAGADVFDMYFPAGLRIVAADFLSGQSGTDGTSLVITVMGESFVL
jgi:hypothetical protein